PILVRVASQYEYCAAVVCGLRHRVLRTASRYGLQMFGPCGVAVPQVPEGDIPEVSQSVVFRSVSQMLPATEEGAGQAMTETMTCTTRDNR
ncbi:MAG: hypothetical protein AAAC47_26030, partial [Pararhizobium sp.]